MRPYRSTLTIGILTALIGSTVHAEGTDVQAQLVEQGQYWQARANTQRAAEIWQKVLLLNQNQVNALYGMGLVGVRQNRLEQANEYLTRLQALSPVPWQARQLAQDIALAKPENRALLDEARRLVDAGERDKATEVFRKMFNGLTPEGTIGREYYNNLAFNPAGWPEARKGMERLLRETPDDSILALFYGKQLIRHDDSRAEGIRVLARLTKHVDIAGDADESWRLALVWMGTPTAAQIPLFEEFLKAHPEDREIREQMNKGRQQLTAGQQNPLVASGLRALEKGNLGEAEKAFQERLAVQPGDPDALGGLGVVRQQQNRFAEAEQLLTRAIANGGRQWKAALDSVRYWSLLQQGRELQAKGQTAQAQEMVAQAMRLEPKNLDGRLTMADIQAQAGEYDKALANYRQVLALQPGHPPAIRGLVSVLAQTGQADEALRLLDSLSPAEQAKFGDQGRLRSLRATQLASVAEQRGDLVGAQNALLDAVQNDPDNVWTRFSLARLYVKSGESQKARELIDAFVKTHPDNVDALYTSALLSVEMERWSEAQATINRIPVDRRTAGMNDLADQITLTVQVKLAVTFAKSGQRQDALELLDRLQPLAGGNPERTAVLASAYVDAGDSARALAMMQSLLAQSSSPSADLRLQYAAILLRTGDDAQVRSILTGLKDQPLSAAARRRYDDLLYLYRVRQADRLREAGDLASAYDMLAPALAIRPGDVAATSALARMYIANGDSAKALELYKPLVQRNPQDTAVLLGAADAAVQCHDNAFVESVLDQFVKLQSTDPASLTEAARVYRAIGKTSEATDLLRQAVAIEQSEKQRSLLARTGAPNVAANPFRKQQSRLASDSASAIPPSAETILDSGIVAAKAGGDGVRGQTRSRPAAAQGYTLGLDTAAASGTPAVAQSQPFAAQTKRPVATSTVDYVSPAQRALDDILQARAAYLTQGVSTRSNDSESGLSKLSDVETPFELNMPLGDNRIALRVTPVKLDAESMSDEAASRFGGGGSSATGVGSQRAEGVGIGVAYARPDKGVKADIGTTPIGFEYTNVVGGVSLERALESSSNVSYGISLSRRAVTDSLTSFAGATDKRSDLSWGGVTANGGRVQLSYDDTVVGVYGYGSAYRLLGHNVESNTRIELGSGAYRYLRNEQDSKLTAGLSATLLGYANNQDFFTYGHGGYFSPQTYVAVGVPVTWMQRSDRFTYQVKGSVGVQYFQQDSADYFPTDAKLQAASNLRYASQSKTGVSYSLEAAGEHRFGSRLAVGGVLGLNNASDYRQISVGVYARYTFEDMKASAMALPVSPYRSPYAN
jgi:tetratricopeptide (TPR) repeat protein